MTFALLKDNGYKFLKWKCHFSIERHRFVSQEGIYRTPRSVSLHTNFAAGLLATSQL